MKGILECPGQYLPVKVYRYEFPLGIVVFFVSRHPFLLSGAVCFYCYGYGDIITLLGLFLQAQRRVDLMSTLEDINMMKASLQTKNNQKLSSHRCYSFNVQRLVICSFLRSSLSNFTNYINNFFCRKINIDAGNIQRRPF